MIRSISLALSIFVLPLLAETKSPVIDGSGPGWKPLTAEDFMDVNCGDKTWTWKGNAVQCTGKPIGVIATKQLYKNFEMIAE